MGASHLIALVGSQHGEVRRPAAHVGDAIVPPDADGPTGSVQPAGSLRHARVRLAAGIPGEDLRDAGVGLRPREVRRALEHHQPAVAAEGGVGAGAQARRDRRDGRRRARRRTRSGRCRCRRRSRDRCSTRRGRSRRSLKHADCARGPAPAQPADRPVAVAQVHLATGRGRWCRSDRWWTRTRSRRPLPSTDGFSLAPPGSCDTGNSPPLIEPTTWRPGSPSPSGSLAESNATTRPDDAITGLALAPAPGDETGLALEVSPRRQADDLPAPGRRGGEDERRAARRHRAAAGCPPRW